MSIRTSQKKKGKHTNMSNTSFVDPFEGSKMSVYPLLGTVMTLAILLNIVNCVVMIKNKDLRKHNQFFVYITISLTEAFVDVLYMVIFFWRQGGLEYFCVFIFLLLTIGREIIQVHLLSLRWTILCPLCVSRSCFSQSNNREREACYFSTLYNIIVCCFCTNFFYSC